MKWFQHVSKLAIRGSDNGFSPGRLQAIIWNNAGIFLIWTLRTNFSEILVKMHIYSFKKTHLKMPSAKYRSFCLSLNNCRSIFQNIACRYTGMIFIKSVWKRTKCTVWIILSTVHHRLIFCYDIFLIQGGLYKCYYVGVYCWLAITLELLKGILRNNG